MKIVEGLDKEVVAIKRDLMRLCWFMRGGLTLDDVYALSYDERQIVAELASENLETTKKTKLPFF